MNTFKSAAIFAMSIFSTALAQAEEVVNNEKELLIMAREVVTSLRATEKTGHWHIRTALQRIAGEGVDVNAFAKAWFKTWADNETVTGANDRFLKRPWVAEALQTAWDNDNIQLVAILNRIDLARFPDGEPTTEPSALGEGRFVYEVRGATGPLTIIFEYGLPGEKTRASLNQWAKDWRALGSIPSAGGNQFSEEFLKALQALTDKFSAHKTLNQIRTNEFLTPDSGRQLWELREFHFDNGRLVQAPVAVTPAFKHNDTPELKAFIEMNEDGILEGQHSSIPVPLIGAVSPVPGQGFTWRSGGAPARASFIVSFNTCSGCHAGDTGTRFQHIGAAATESGPTTSISKFLKGPITLAQPLPEQVDTVHDEMGIRAKLLIKFSGDLRKFDDPKLRADVKARANRVH
jgi:hypothetical protein